MSDPLNLEDRVALLERAVHALISSVDALRRGHCEAHEGTAARLEALEDLKHTHPGVTPA